MTGRFQQTMVKRGTGLPDVADAEDFIVFGQPQILDDEIDEVVECLRSGWIGTGPKVQQFEQEFATFKGVDDCAALASCTAALHLSLLLANLKPGDEVITSALTFCATANAIVHAGGRPVLADIDAATMNVDPLQVEAAITERTRAIVPVHFAGRPCEMDALTAIAERHGLRLIEDCAHGIEAEYQGRGVGTFGDFGCFSFYATKNVTTAEGGMLIAGSRDHLDRIRTLSLHGQSYDAWQRANDQTFRIPGAVAIGYKYNMTDLQAAIGIHQLRRISVNWQRRRAIWSDYMEALRAAPVELPPAPQADSRHACHLFTLLIDEARCGIDRAAFLDGMTERGIGVGVHYPSLGEQPVYQERFGWRAEQWPNACRTGRQTVSLPLGPALSAADVSRVIDAVLDTLRV